MGAGSATTRRAIPSSRGTSVPSTIAPSPRWRSCRRRILCCVRPAMAASASTAVTVEVLFQHPRVNSPPAPPTDGAPPAPPCGPIPPEPDPFASILILAALPEERDHPGLLPTGVGKLKAAYVAYALRRVLQQRWPLPDGGGPCRAHRQHRDCKQPRWHPGRETGFRAASPGGVRRPAANRNQRNPVLPAGGGPADQRGRTLG